MKHLLKKICAVTLLVSVLMTTGCNFLSKIGLKTKTTEQESSSTQAEVNMPADLNGFSILRGKDGDQDELAVISEFYLSLKNDFGFDVSLYIDEETPKGGNEILVGKTNRADAKNYRYSDFSIECRDGSIYIDGGSADAIKTALNWFTTNCIVDGALNVTGLPFVYQASYSLENLKICGIPLSNFSIVCGDSEAEASLRKWIGTRAGTQKTSEYTLTVVADPTLNFNEIGLELIGKEFRLSASSHLGDLSVVTEFFLDAIKTRESDELTFNGKETIEMPEPSVSLVDVRDSKASKKYLSTVTDKDPLSYQIGDDVVFICTLYGDSNVISCPRFFWTVRTEDGMVHQGESDGAFGKVIVKVPATGVGGVRLTVSVQDEYGSKIADVASDPIVFSAIVNADEKTTSKNEPADFDEFWAEQVAKVTAVSPDVLSMEKVTSPSGIIGMDGAVGSASGHDFYRVKIKTPDECGYAVGYLTIPKNAKANSLGITVVFNGYGVGDLSPYVSAGHIVLNVCAHSFELGRESSYYSELSSNSLKNYGFTNTNNRDTVYFRTMIMRDLQAVRFIKAYAGTAGVSIEGGSKTSLGLWNGRLRVYGGSQGGFQGIAVAALDHDVTDAYWTMPWMCDIGGVASEFRPTYTTAMGYYDSVYFAKRIPKNFTVNLTSGLGDYICPPSGVVALYNALNCKVTMYFKQGMTHSFTPDKAITTVYQK